MRISPFFLRRVPLKTGVKNFCRLWRVVWAGAKRPSQIVTTDIEMGGGDNIASAHFAKCTVVLNRTIEPLERLAVVVKPRRQTSSNSIPSSCSATGRTRCIVCHPGALRRNSSDCTVRMKVIASRFTL